jgi:pSer/pThr/pTyr-binding forkhead associated (FHA) protein/2'-5' RNA ligase
LSERVLDSFSAACGATGPLLFEVQDRNVAAGPPRVFAQPFLVVGRTPPADLTLDDQTVSRRHCYLQLVEGRLYGIDLGGRTGTRLFGQSRPVSRVRRGETIEIGSFELRFQGGDAEADSSEEPPCPLTSRPVGPDPLPGVTLEIVGQGLKPFLCRLSRVLTLIGRSPLCRVRLHDPRVSRLHCALLRTPTGVWMVDLIPREGTLHNGTPRRLSWLDDGDLLCIGSFTIRLRYDFSPRPLESLSDGQPGPLFATGFRSPREAGAPAVPWPMAKPSTPSSNDPGMEAALRPFVEHVALMQQQMSDQFHRAVMMMAEVFGSMHCDQMQLVRGELEQIRKLTEEMHALREKLEQAESAQAPTAARPGDRPLMPPKTIARPESTPGPSPQARPRDERQDSRPEANRPRSREGFATDSDESHGPPAPDRHIRRDPKEAQAPLTELLARYEHERQSRWSRVLSYLTGR